MISTARGDYGGLRYRDAKPRVSAWPNWLQDILQSIRWMHREHVKDLRSLGYSPKEAYWLDFACLPFLPWDKAAGPEIRLSTILRLYADLHRATVDPRQPADARSFIDLLKHRYRTVRQRVAESDQPVREAARPQPAGEPKPPTGDAKEALASMIVMRTAREWRQHRTSFPCRLVEDI